MWEGKTHLPNGRGPFFQNAQIPKRNEEFKVFIFFRNQGGKLQKTEGSETIAQVKGSILGNAQLVGLVFHNQIFTIYRGRKKQIKEDKKPCTTRCHLVFAI